MCIFGSSDKGSTQTTSLDPQTQSTKNIALDKALSLSNVGYTQNPNRVAAPNSDQQTGFNLLRSNAQNYDPSNMLFAQNAIRDYGTQPQSVMRPDLIGAAPTLTAGQQGAVRQLDAPQLAAQQVGVHGVGPAQQISTEGLGLMEEGGRLGTIDSYMNPFLKQVLDPTLRTIGEQGAQARNSIKAGATSAGAFGDARHGVVESNQRTSEAQNVSDTTGRAYAASYDDAMARRGADRGVYMQGDIYNADSKTRASEYNAGASRSADEYNTSSRTSNNENNAGRTMQAGQFNIGNEINREQFNIGQTTDASKFNIGNLIDVNKFNSGVNTNAQVANANFRDSALARMLTGSNAMIESEAAKQTLDTARANNVLGAGNQQQANTQAQLDAAQEERLREQEAQYRQLDVLLSLLNGTPNSQTVSTKQTGGANPLASILGSAIGAAV